MLEKQALLQLMKTVAKADKASPVAYSYNDKQYNYEQLNEALRVELAEYAGTYAKYRANKDLIFEILEETINDVVPAKVARAYESFAETRTFGQGDKPLFRRKVSARNRAKQFVTRVGLAGVYEVFKLGGSESFEVPSSAIGAACQISIEEFLDGRVDFAELLDIVIEGMDDLIYQEVAHALVAAIGQLPQFNKVSTNGFDEAAFDRLITIAAAYGNPVIYTSYDFAVKMIPAKQWMYSDRMKEDLWNKGHFTDYKGNTVIILPNGFVDETNSERVLDPGYCWIIPTGGDKPVKIAFEGETLMDERKNDDWSREIQVYKKVGVAALMTPDICSYVDTSLQGKVSTQYAGDPSNYKYTNVTP